jgi:hypothetical protein
MANPTEQSRNVFMCLDVKKYSFGASTTGASPGIVILVLFTLGYWFLAFAFLQSFMFLLDTISKTKPMTIYIIVYLLIAQKVTRVFIIKEKERLKEFLESSRKNIVTIGDFYDIKSAGYEPLERNHPRTGKPQEFHRIKYRNGAEEYAVKFSRGSITSEFADIETTQVQSECTFLNALMTQSILPRIILSDERIERSVTFKFFQHKLKTGDFDDEFIDLCNSTILYHEQTAEKYSRIPATYYFIPAKTPKQKIFMQGFIKNVGNNIQFTSFRDASPMNKIQILNMYKDLNYLNAINERELQTEDVTRRVPLGITKTLYIRNILTDETEVINESNLRLTLDSKGIEHEIRRRVGVTVQNTNLNTQPEEQDIDFELSDSEKFGVDHLSESEVEKFVTLLKDIQRDDCEVVML